MKHRVPPLRPGHWRLWLVRHAEPCVPAGVCYGRTDVPADEHATAQAAQRLAQDLPAMQRVAVSGLQRARQLAQDLAQRRPDWPEVQPDARLNEMNFGAWELQPWDAIDRAALDAWTADFAHHRVGAGESVMDLLTRVQAAWCDTARAAQAPGSAVWVTHAGVIRAVHWLRSQQVLSLTRPSTAPLPQPVAADWPRPAPGFGGVCWLDWPLSA